MQFPNDANGAVLQSMVDAGMDLTQEHEIEFCHLFPDEDSALEMEQRMSKKNIDVDIYNNAELMEDAEMVAPERSCSDDRDSQWLGSLHYFFSAGASTA